MYYPKTNFYKKDIIKIIKTKYDIEFVFLARQSTLHAQFYTPNLEKIKEKRQRTKEMHEKEPFTSARKVPSGTWISILIIINFIISNAF